MPLRLETLTSDQESFILAPEIKILAYEAKILASET